MTLREAASDYVRRGWAVFPLVERDKIPAVQGGFKAATHDLEQIEATWDYRPHLNVGIATGSMSNGLVVIDLDVDPMKGEDGLETLRLWEKEHGELPETVTAITGSGGMHLYYICNTPIACSVDNEKGVDIRGDGGYVVAPPSRHPNGRNYEWENHPEDYAVAKADANVYAFIRSIQGERGRGDKPKFKLPDTIGSGKRNDTLYRQACSLQSMGYDDDLIYATIETTNRHKCNPPLSDSEVRKIVEQALQYQKGQRRPMETAAASMEPKAALMLKANGAPQQTIENCTRVLNTDPALAGRFRYDEMAYTRTITLPVPWDKGEGTRPITDADYCGLAAFMEREYGLMNKNKAIDAVTNAAMANRWNPLTEWLDSLKWDGEERISLLLPMFLGCDPSDYNMAVMHLFLQGAVRRAYEPGCKFDYMLVLIGAQGLGKSTFLSKLAGRGDWYCDNLNTIEGDAATEKLRGMWILEMAELLATKRQKDVEGIKAFVTSRVDVIRPKYGKETEQRKRTCVFAGTTNNRHFLTDKTGNRRFLPVDCGVHEPAMSLFDKGTEEYFEQVLAEAVHIYKTKRPKLVLGETLQKYAMERQQDYLEDDPRVGVIQDYLDGLEDGVRVCVAEICERALQLRREEYYGKRSLSNEIHAIMQHDIAGWRRLPKKVKVAGYGAQYCYTKGSELDFSEL